MRQYVGEKMSLQQLAVDTAQQIRARENVDASIVLLCDPELEENADGEQGSAVAVATGLSTAFRVYGFGARSNLARDWLSRWGLANLWRMLKEEYEDGDVLP